MASESGRILWDTEANSFRDLALIDDFLYLVSNDDHVYAVDTVSGEIRWQQDALEFRNLTAPAVYQGKIIVGDSEGYLHVLDNETGKLLGRVHINGSPVIFVSSINDGLVALTENGTLAAFTVSSEQ